MAARPDSLTIPRPEEEDLLEGITSATGPAALVVEGTAGSGKTTTIRRALSRLGDTYRSASVSVSNPSRDIADPGAPLVEAVGQIIAAELADADSEQRRARLMQRVDAFLDVVAIASGPVAVAFPPAALLGALALVPKARSARARQARQQRPAASPVDALRTLVAAEKQAVIHVGDAQWLGDTSRAALAEIVDALSGSVRLVLELRSETDPADSVASATRRFLRVLTQRTDVRWVELRPLTSLQLEELVERRFTRNGFPPSFAREVYAMSGGSPMVAGLLLERLVGSGVVKRDADGYWQVDSRLGATLLHLTDKGDPLTALLLDTWEQLPADQRAVLTVLAVAASPLDFSVVEDIARQANGVGAYLDAVSSLVDQQLIVEGPGDALAIAHEVWSAFIASLTSRTEQRVLNGLLATRADDTSARKAGYMLGAGNRAGAIDQARFAMEYGAEIGNWMEVTRALELLKGLDADDSPDAVTYRVHLLRRQGRTTEALELVDAMPDTTPVELRADLVHLAGHYRRAYEMLHEALTASGLDERTAWKVKLRSIHHLKFTDPLEAARRLDQLVAQGDVAPGLRGLAAYTYWGSVRSFTAADEDMRDGLAEAVALAQAECDVETIAKAYRKLGEYYAFVDGDMLNAEAAWLEGTEAVAVSESRQLAYLDTVSYWVKVAAGAERETVQGFYRGRRSHFARLGIRGWEAHCELLLAEALRCLGHTEQVIPHVRRAEGVYQEIDQIWGVRACALVIALAQGGDATIARDAAIEAGLVPLSASGDAVRPVALLLP